MPFHSLAPHRTLLGFPTHDLSLLSLVSVARAWALRRPHLPLPTPLGELLPLSAQSRVPAPSERTRAGLGVGHKPSSLLMAPKEILLDQVKIPQSLQSGVSLPVLTVCVQKPCTQADSILGVSSLHGHARDLAGGWRSGVGSPAVTSYGCTLPTLSSCLSTAWIVLLCPRQHTSPSATQAPPQITVP